jgi:AcrR family transcriptional regulator
MRQQSVESLTMRELAATAGVAVPTLYNLFGSKTEILLAVARDGQLIDHEALESVPLTRPLDRVRAAVDHGVIPLLKRPDEARARILVLRVLAMTGDAVEIWHENIEMVRVALDSAAERGLILDGVDTRILAAQIYDGCRHAAERWVDGELTDDGFLATARYHLHLALCGVVTDSRQRRKLQARLITIQKELVGSYAESS